jgi:hypothetical protein
LFAILQLQQKYQKHFLAITISVPACEPVPLNHHGFDNRFY